MTEAELLKFRDQLYAYALKKLGSVEYAEDCASWGVMKILEGTVVPNLKFVFIDFMRTYNEQSRRNRQTFVSHTKFQHRLVPIYNFLEDESDTTGSLDKLTFFKKFLHESDFQLLQLVLLGYNGEEMGKFLGVTPTRISQRLASIKYKLLRAKNIPKVVPKPRPVKKAPKTNRFIVNKPPPKFITYEERKAAEVPSKIFSLTEDTAEWKEFLASRRPGRRKGSGGRPKKKLDL